jgi:hypothetical protein
LLPVGSNGLPSPDRAMRSWKQFLFVLD